MPINLIPAAHRTLTADLIKYTRSLSLQRTVSQLSKVVPEDVTLRGTHSNVPNDPIVRAPGFLEFWRNQFHFESESSLVFP